jgi:hypothetical protein
METSRYYFLSYQIYANLSLIPIGKTKTKMIKYPYIGWSCDFKNDPMHTVFVNDV